MMNYQNNFNNSNNFNNTNNFNNSFQNQSNTFNNNFNNSNYNNQNNYKNNNNYNNNYPYDYNNQNNYNNYNNTNSKDQFPNYNKSNFFINRDMNNYFRSLLKSRGIGLSRGNLLNKGNDKFEDLRQKEQDRKKILMNNILNQISLSNSSKMEELERQKKEDQQYLKDMINSFPFGRGGGGAPVRDKNGNIVAVRRNLISDPKYNLVQINVDDDYYDVWGRDKTYGIINFKNENVYGGFVNNFARSLSATRNNNLYNNSNNISNNNNNNNFNYGLSRNYSFNQSLRNNNNNNFNVNNNGSSFRPRSTNPQNYNYNFINRNNNGMNYNNIRKVDEFPTQEEYSNLNDNTNLNSLDIQDYEIERIKKDQQYANELLLQIRDNQNRRLLEKRIKEEEDAREEERLKKENEDLERRAEEEREKYLLKKRDIDNENYNKSLERKKNEQRKRKILKSLGNGYYEEINEEEIEEVENSENNEEDKEKKNQYIENIRKLNEEKLRELEQKELDSKYELNNEIIKLRQQMQDQQNDLYNQINFLKEQTHKANIERFEALKEVEKLKDEIVKQKNEEEMRKNYVKKVINDNINYEDEYNNNHPEFEKDLDKRLNDKIDYNLNLGESYYNKEINKGIEDKDDYIKSKTYNPNEIHSFNYTKNSFSSNKLSDRSKNIDFQFFKNDQKNLKKYNNGNDNINNYSHYEEKKTFDYIPHLNYNENNSDYSENEDINRIYNNNVSRLKYLDNKWEKE